MKQFIIVLLILCGTLLGFEATVVRVVDGYTIKVSTNTNLFTVRLWGLDAPSLSQSYGTNAQAALDRLIYGKTISVIEMGKDPYGKLLALVNVGTNQVNAKMIETGCAWAVFLDEQRRDLQLSFKILQAQARTHRLGLWSEANPQSPYQYRVEMYSRTYQQQKK